uniref:interaptin isoform X2 n=1 Tax=Gasterosteus aculeatus aculeatus TaxID=481459 RepID=UPI001A98218A|nr:interaptin isoform X2 [Gasterosteus aculeatus aculeatus]XP_040015890.1 interaptin isoform X2 [Gasterosteus aculeatus aculeatus]
MCFCRDAILQKKCSTCLQTFRMDEYSWLCWRSCQGASWFRSSSQRIFRLNNISKALAFLDDRHVKLPGIDATGIADGIPSAVLDLVWNIVLYFQVKKVTQGLQRHLSSSLFSLTTSIYPSSSDLLPQPNDIGSYSGNTLPSKGRKAAKGPKYHGKAIKTLLQWVQRCTSRFGVEVHDFGRSWRSGLAFLALIKSINPYLVDLTESLSKQPRENIQLAFTIAQHSLDIQPLLEPEDVLGRSLDERSIITYVSMFPGRRSGTDEDDTTNIRWSEIPNCGSLESVIPEKTHADEPNAQESVQGLEKSREQLLWKRWSQRSSGSPVNTSEATSLFNKKKSRSQSILQLPSPLDAGVVNQEIRSWMDQGNSKPRVDESHFSFSSEEGIYSLSALDSDEEEAYSYILDLNKEVFPPHKELKRQVPRVEEETEEDMFMSRHQTEEFEHLKTWKTSNGRGHQEDSLTQNVEPENRAQSVAHWEKKNIERVPLEKCGQVIENQVVANKKEEEKALKFNEGQDRKSGKEQEEGYKDEEMENQQSFGSFKVGVKAIVVTDNTTYEVKGAAKSRINTKEANYVTENGPNIEESTNEDDKEECRDGAMNPVGGAAEQKDRSLKMKKQELTGKAPTAAGKMGLKSDTRGGVNVRGVERYRTPACTAAPPSSREEGFTPQSSAAPWDVTPSEQSILLVLWILLYCYFIF